MPDFAIITPTIGRDTLSRCLGMMRHQVLKDFDYIQIVVGDGPQQIREQCEAEPHVVYMETTVKEGFYGTAPRNAALEAIEKGKFGNVAYILFVDDDNLLLEPALYNIMATIQRSNRPPLLWQDILFTNKYKTEYCIMPSGGKPVVEGDWDSLSGIYRADVIHGLRWKAVYRHDYLFALEAQVRSGGAPWVKCPGIGGVHCLSWDTYELKS